MDVSPLNLGMIAAYYNISCKSRRRRRKRKDGLTPPLKDVTVEVYTLSLKERTKMKGLLEVVSSSAEFETIPIRRHEDVLLKRIYERVPVKLDNVDSAVSVGGNVLLEGGSRTIDIWGQGNIYSGNKPNSTGNFVQGDITKPSRPNVLLDNEGRIFGRAHPQ